MYLCHTPYSSAVIPENSPTAQAFFGFGIKKGMVNLLNVTKCIYYISLQ